MGDDDDGTRIYGRRLHRKSRAPDLVCLFGTEITETTTEKQPQQEEKVRALAIIEVAVASNPERVRQTKMTKYHDLVDIIDGCQLITVVIGDDGSIPNGTKKDVEKLIEMTSRQDDGLLETEVRRICSILSNMVA
mmetsp:Transcript_35459/g.85802  ORF Transcript_35459/g.85802 Transcript_35459/m.85802 type:complete len:135 (-) Transcript_35459:281-685(-)